MVLSLSSFDGSPDIYLLLVIFRLQGCPLDGKLWKLRNRACFEEKLINSRTDLVCYSTIFMNYWASLHNHVDGDVLWAGASTLTVVPMEVHQAGAHQASSSNRS
jgi:hypothetical protein